MLRRHKDFTIELSLHRDSFIAAPRAEQQRWVLHRAVDELAEQLRHLDVIAPDFVGGATRAEIEAAWGDSPAAYGNGELIIEGQQVMQDWERELMRRMAQRAAASHGDVLEIGFGLGLSATFIEECGVRSHTIVEFNEEVFERANAWAAARPGADIEILNGSWQEQMPLLGDFDGVFWDAFPTSEDEFDQYVLRDSTVAEAFFGEAASHLRPGGVLTYYTNERDSLSRRHQRSLLRYFSSFAVEVVDGLAPPPDCEYWWTDRMTVVTATPVKALDGLTGAQLQRLEELLGGQVGMAAPELVAYYVPAGGETPSEAELRAHVGRRLPPSHVPARFVAVDALPRLANGKVDRRALPAVTATVAGDVPLAGELQRWLAGVWSAVLGTPVRSASADFFAVGGDSLRALQVFGRIESVLGTELRLASIFEHSTVASFAEAVREQAAGVDRFDDVVAVAAEVYGDGPADD